MKNEEDIDFEPEDEFGDVNAAKAKLKKLREELEQVKKERQEYLDGWQRAKADMVNSRQELMRQAERAGERKLESFIEDVIHALDGFDVAANSEGWENLSKEWRTGIEQVRNQFLEVLRRHGIERYGKAGDTVDHRLYETVEETEDLPGAPGTVFRVLRFGYKMGERVIRPAQVIVKK